MRLSSFIFRQPLLDSVSFWIPNGRSTESAPEKRFHVLDISLRRIELKESNYIKICTLINTQRSRSQKDERSLKKWCSSRELMSVGWKTKRHRRDPFHIFSSVHPNILLWNDLTEFSDMILIFAGCGTLMRF